MAHPHSSLLTFHITKVAVKLSEGISWVKSELCQVSVVAAICGGGKEVLEFHAGLITILRSLVMLWARVGKLAYIKPCLSHWSHSASDGVLLVINLVR